MISSQYLKRLFLIGARSLYSTIPESARVPGSMATFSAKITDLSALDTSADEDKRSPLSQNTEKGLYGVEGGEANEESQDTRTAFFKKPLFLGALGFSAVALFSLIFAITRGRGGKLKDGPTTSTKQSLMHLSAEVRVATATNASFIPSMMKRPVVLASVAGVALVALAIMIYLIVSHLDEEERRKKEELLRDKLIRDKLVAVVPGWLDLTSTKSLVVAGALIVTLTSVIGLVGYRKGWFSKTPPATTATTATTSTTAAAPTVPKNQKKLTFKWGNCVIEHEFDLSKLNDLNSLITYMNTEKKYFFLFDAETILHSDGSNITESLDLVSESEDLIVVPVKKEREAIFVIVKSGYIEGMTSYDYPGSSIHGYTSLRDLISLLKAYGCVMTFFNVELGVMKKIEQYFFKDNFKGLPIYVEVSTK